MGFTAIDLAVVVVYLIGIATLGIYQAKKVKHTGDFFAGGRKFNKFLMMMHALGTGTHADDPTGVMGAAYKQGLSGIWYTFVYLFITPFYWIIAPLFRRSRYLTTADFFEARFGKPLGTLYAVWGILIFAVNMGMLLKGTGIIVDAVTQGTVPESYAIIGMTIIFLIYGTAGGLIATVVTESIQGLLIVVMSLMLVPFGLMKLGGITGLSNAVSDPAMFNITGTLELSIWWILAGILMNLINIVAQPHTMEVCSTGKTEFEGRIGFTYGNFVKRFCALGWVFTGLIVVGLAGAGLLSLSDMDKLSISRESAFGIAIRNLLPPGGTGLMFAAILAAQMSTLSAFMVAASALLSRNVYKKHINPSADENKMLFVARISGFSIVVLGVLFAYYVKGVADAIMWFWTLSTFTGLFMWAGVLWKKTNATGAWASFVVMLTIWFIIGEPGAAISQYIAKKNYQPVVSQSIIDENTSNLKPVSRVLLKVKMKRGELEDGEPVMKTYIKDVIVLFTHKEDTSLGISADSDGKGMKVTKIEPKMPASRAGLKEGDVILSASKMNMLGVYADKNLLHFRLIAFLPAGIIALIIGSLLGKSHPKDKLDTFYTLLKTPVGKESELIEKGIDAVYSGNTEGHPWEMNHSAMVNIIGFIVALLISGAFFGLLWLISTIGNI